jgi:LCP family protein required for cell wall assembly
VTTPVRPSSHRSAFAAAFLSFIFPGLGHLYLRAYLRAFVLALPLLAAIAALAGIILVKGVVWFGLWVGQTDVLGPFVVVNVIMCGYRAFAAIDAWRLAVEPAAPGQKGRFGTKPGEVHPLSVLGLATVLVVLIAGHVFAGYWDLKLYNFAQDIHAPVQIAEDTPDPSASAEPTDSPPPTVTFPPQMTYAPAATIQPWTGTGRLNILLVGFDASGRRTDSMMVVSIDPKTHQVAMFSILRDATGVPMPPRSRLSQLWGPYFNSKLTSLWSFSDKYRTLFPHGGSDALKQALGYVFFGNQNAIQYYVSVGFPGFTKLVDTLGGVTINVPAPVFDNGFPGNNSGRNGHLRVFFQAGIQHMTGDEALTYARIGHVYGSSVYARSVRQQQVVVALEQQANFDEISSHLSELIDQLGQTVKTDIPQDPDKELSLLELAKSVKLGDIKSYVWATSHPDYAAIRAVVKSVLNSGTKSSDQLQGAISEKAPIIVENGTGVSGQDTSVASFLQNLGLDAQASASQPGTLGGTTKLLCVNGAATQFPATFAELEAMLGLSGPPSDSGTGDVQNLNEPGEVTGFVIQTGANLPTMSIPPG